MRSIVSPLRSLLVLSVLASLPSLSAGTRGTARAADVGGEGLFHAEPALEYEQLEALIRRYSPQLRPAQREEAVARAGVAQARLLDNPTLDLAWGTLPVGRTNPTDLDRPFANVPSYGAGIAYTFPIGKRGPRVKRAAELAAGAAAEGELRTRELALALASVLGELATATLRREGMEELVSGGQRSVELAAARLRAKFGTPLEVDRLTVDVQRTRQLALGVAAQIEEALATCAQLLATPCQGFADGASARAYLARWTGREFAAAPALSERADVRMLDAQIAARRAEHELAAAQAIPDPTVRVGYLHDRFVVSGNQRNSLQLGVALPLPVFERGQVQKQAAASARRALVEERALRLAGARARIPLLKRRLSLQRERCTTLAEQVLPEGRAVLKRLEQAVDARLLPLGDVLQARRTVSELLIEEAESCGDAYQAALELIREIPERGK